jgi:hypothetical protein
MNATQTFSSANDSVAQTGYDAVLKRVGWVILACALAEIVWPLVAGLSNVNDFRSIHVSLPVFSAVIALALLFSKSLRIASILRWFLVFVIAAGVTSLAFSPFLTPLGLQLAKFRIQPMQFFGDATLFTVGMVVKFWIVRELGSAVVQAARSAQGKKRRNMYIPAALGAILCFTLSVVALMILNGSAAERAKAEALNKLGPGYQLHVTNLSLKNSRLSTSSWAEVTAWNENEITKILVDWNR